MNLPSLITSFFSAGVEFFEIAAIGYAMGRAGFQREAVAGTAAGLTGISIASLFSWRAMERIPVHVFQGCVGLMLMSVGGWWTFKSVKRKLQHRRAGWISDPLGKSGTRLEAQPAGFSIFNAIVMAKSAAVEGLEVAVILVSIGVASHAWIEITAGGILALAATFATVTFLHGRLKNVPEVLIKLFTGVILFTLGVFWVLESLPRGH